MDGVPDKEVRRLLSVARRRRFSRNEVVFHREDPADSLHLISKGRFAIRIMTPSGRRSRSGSAAPAKASGRWRSWRKA
jgi:CRP/FNR family cyclic AMP-dependent transcriptional regulator